MSASASKRKDFIAIYPGTFDPITNGHCDLIQRGLCIFDRIIVAVVAESGKDPLFTLAERVYLAQEATTELKKVEVESFSGLLVNYARSKGAEVIIRGLRAVSDFEYEFQMALMNRHLSGDIETVFMMPSEEYTYLSSSLVKEVVNLGGSVKGLVPEAVLNLLCKKFPKNAL